MEKYDILAQIGEGSFGRVHKARMKYTGRLLAVKLINKCNLSSDDQKSLKREIDLLQRAKHPHIMRMIDWIETDSSICIVSELARGDLFQVIDDESTLPEKEIKPIAAQLVNSLAYLHSQKIIHRDMKPQNILVCDDGRVKICDFGFARALSRTTVVLRSVKGTPLYMAPELVQEEEYVEKVDIWSLGIILYELFYGMPPYYTESVYTLINMIVKNPIEWPESKHISKEFKNFLLRMLQKDPQKRASASELIHDDFIKDVDLSKYDDSISNEKSVQFEKAVKEGMKGFKPRDTEQCNHQAMFLSSSSYSDQDLLGALNEIIDTQQSDDSLIVSTFVQGFQTLLERDSIIDTVMCVATYVIRLNVEKFWNTFYLATPLMPCIRMTSWGMVFFQTVLCIQVCRSLVYGEGSHIEIDFTDEDNAKLEETLVRFLSSSGNDVINSVVLVAFLARASESFLSVIAGHYSTILPLLTQIVIEYEGVAKCAAFGAMTLIMERNLGGDSLEYISPLDRFLGTLNKITRQDIKNTPSFLVFLSALSFLLAGWNQLSVRSDFQAAFGLKDLSNEREFIYHILKRRSEGLPTTVSVMLELAKTDPVTEGELLSYLGIIESPFAYIPLIDDAGKCVQYTIQAMPIHQGAILISMFDYYSDIEKVLPDMSPLFASTTASRILSEKIQSLMNPDLANRLIKNRALVYICDILSGDDYQANVVDVLVLMILTIKPDSKKLVELVQSGQRILNILFRSDETMEHALVIASQFARLATSSRDFYGVLESVNVLEKAWNLARDQQFIRRALDCIANIAKLGPLPTWFVSNPDYIEGLITFMENENDQIAQMACLVLANILFYSPRTARIVANLDRSDVLINLLKSNDRNTVKQAALVCAYLVRESDELVPYLIDNGILKEFLAILKRDIHLGEVICHPLVYACMHKRSKDYLVQNDLKSLITPYTNCEDAKARKEASKIIGSL